MTVHMITDGSADLPESVRSDWGIRVVPLGVRFGDEEFDSTMTAERFYAKMRSAPALPQTSSPAPHAFMDAYRSVPAGEPIVVVTLSSQVSSTYRHAVLAKEMLQEERPDVLDIEVIDSKTASVGLGSIVYKAAKLAKEDAGFQDIASAVKRLVAETRTQFVLDTLENVIKGGRLDRVRGAVASMLNIKLLMHASEQGTIEVLEKVRGASGAVKRLIDRIEEIKDDAGERLLSVAHSNCEARAKALVRDILEKYKFREVMISDMGPVIGTYAGEGGLLISY